MEIQVTENADHLYVKLTGSLDLKGTQQADMKFHAAVATRRMSTIVDLSDVDFVASLGMGMFVSCSTTLRRNGKPMVFLNPQAAVAESLRHARLDKIVPIVTTMDEAISALQPAPQG